MQENITQHRESLALRLETLIRIRWLAVVGQTVAVLFVYFQLGFDLLLFPCLLIIAASAWLNIFLRFRYPGNVRWRGWAVTALLAYDLLQLTLLLYLTGGIQNPFAMLIAVPVVVSAAAQRMEEAGPLLILAILVSGLLVFFHLPLPWFEPGAMILPLELRVGIWVAIVSTMGFTSFYAYRVANESRNLADALAATEIVLQREQHISTLDGLATAAAHELGTPLATISLVSKELMLSARTDSLIYEDAALLKSQADRCREILKKISTLSSEEDVNIANLSIQVLMEEVSAPHREHGILLELNQGGEGPIPVTRRNSAILYGLGNLLENAIDFAKAKVEFNCVWDEDKVVFIIQDDGKGFPLGVLDKIGDPYISDRPGPRKMSGGGLGLGMFIAKTLLERNGAILSFSNYANGNRKGAEVRIQWKRSDFEKRT
ncbi:MAG: ActS/PrrB/RegB family redox-sensitive histidine kinase [Salaquimonas sp.]